MKSEFIIKEKHPRLTILFSGWGGEPNLFSEYVPEASDFLLCWDYRDLSFDSSQLEDYKEIRVVAWSLGVWVAEHVLGQQTGLVTQECIAVNGTLKPVDDRFGIPVQVFRGTLENMSEAVLAKFRRRMCGSAEGLEAFLAHGLRRSAAELRDELETLYLAVTQNVTPAASESADISPGPTNIADSKISVQSPTSPRLKWTQALIASDDRIFPAENQGAAWRGNVNVSYYPDAHYSQRMLALALNDRKSAE